MRLLDLSIKRKIMLITMLTSGVALFIACAGLVVYDVVTFRSTLVNNLSILAKVIGDNSSGAVVFSDPGSAVEILAALNAQQHITSACIYSQNGGVFASYQRINFEGDDCPSEALEAGYRFKDAHLQMILPIVLDDEKIGMTYIESDLEELNSRLTNFGGVILVIMFATGMIALMISSRLQRVITQPIFSLVETAKIVSTEKDYSVRAEKYGNDETGILIDNFNDMLSHIQERDAQIIAAKEQTDELLHAILPARIAAELRTFGKVQPRRLENVAIMMGDIVGFTHYCESHDPQEVIADLQVISDEFEEITERHYLAKINAVGDAFMAVADGNSSPKQSVLQCVKCGLELQKAVKNSSTGLEIRIGVHIGPVVAGIVGKKKFLYGMFGDTVNTASRMESNGRPEIVCLSSAAWDLVSDACEGASQGMFEVKGKGKMEVFFVSEVRSQG